MKRIALSALLVICLAALGLSVSGCQLLAQKATEGALKTATGGAVDVKGDSVTLTGKDGSQATVSGDTKIPADFPSDVPMRDDGSVKAVITNQTPSGGTGYMINIRFKIPQTELLDWYKTELEKGGWKITSTVSTGDGGMVAAEKGDLTINVVTGSDNSEGFSSVITMQVSPKSK
jgi:hypothetical protein